MRLAPESPRVVGICVLRTRTKTARLERCDRLPTARRRDGVATNNITGKREDRFSHIYIIGKNTCQACVLELPGVARRRAQLSFGDGFDCGRSERSSRRPDEDADAVLADEEIVAAVYEALGKRRPKSRCRGRRGVPDDVVLRLLILKHRATRC
jgi:hypothetical protein